MKCFLGIDIGTTNIKSVLFKENWQVVHLLENEIETHNPTPGFFEQDPEALLSSTFHILNKSLLHATAKGYVVQAIGLSTAMHSFLPVDQDLKPLSNLIIWSDTRSVQVSDSLKKNSTVKKYIEKSNVPMHPMLPLTKWMWFNQYSGIQDSIFKILSFKDYLIANWFGEFITDHSSASSTGYYDIKTGDWNIPLLQYLKLDTRLLPEIVSTVTVLENWSPMAANELKLKSLPPLVIGASDGCLANIAAGVLDNTKASLTIGTSGAVRTAYNKPPDQNQRLFCYPVLEDYYVVGGAVNNGGNVIEWFKNSLFNAKGEFWAELNRSIEVINPGSDGLYFLPYINGERAPLWDPSLKGSYLGITGSHNNQHFLKSSLEGIAYVLKHIFALIDARPNTIKSLVVDGGFTNSPPWVQLICDVIGVEVFCPDSNHGAAKGAAMLAKIAVDNEVLENLISTDTMEGEVFMPNKNVSNMYDNLFLNYLNLSSAIISI